MKFYDFYRNKKTAYLLQIDGLWEKNNFLLF